MGTLPSRGAIIALSGALCFAAPPRLVPADCTGTLATIGVRPLNDLGPDVYVPGHFGGLYPGGLNMRPAEHLSAGLELAQSGVAPRNPSGDIDLAEGRIGMVSIGMSNTSQEFAQGDDTFLPRASSDPAVHPQLVLVNGAQGGQAAEDWVSGDRTWDVLAARVAAAGLAPAQVQVAWMKHANRRPGSIGAFPTHARKLQSDLAAILRRLRAEYPHVSMAYLSSRTRAYTDNAGSLNPEPFAYESGFSVRWVIEDQLEGGADLDYRTGEAPWLSWGPYLWVDGENARSDGLRWFASDLRDDCTHPSTTGRVKVADQLIAHFKADATTAPWFLRPTPEGEGPRVTVAPSEIEGTAPLTVRFELTATPRAGTSITQVAWSFDDGGTSLAEDPTKVFFAPGDYLVSVTASDSNGGNTRRELPVTVTPSGEPEPPVILEPVSPLEGAEVGVPVSIMFIASGTPPLEWTVAAGEPPTGMTLSSGGLYSGTPTAAGGFAFRVEVRNSAGAASALIEHGVRQAAPSVDILPSDDAFVRGGRFASRNFGLSERLAVRAASDPGQTARSYIKFDLRGIDQPSRLESAMLELYLENRAGGGPVAASILRVTDDAWTEDAITWDSRPDTAGAVATVDVGSAASVYAFDVTEVVAADLSGDGVTSLAVVDLSESEAMLVFESREGGAHPPRLELRFSEKPPLLLRGDCDGDGRGASLTDAVFLLRFAFQGGARPPCIAACDANGDGALDALADAVQILIFRFRGGTPPPPPFPECGAGSLPADAALGCVRPRCP